MIQALCVLLVLYFLFVLFDFACVDCFDCFDLCELLVLSFPFVSIVCVRVASVTFRFGLLAFLLLS